MEKNILLLCNKQWVQVPYKVDKDEDEIIYKNDEDRDEIKLEKERIELCNLCPGKIKK